MEDLMRQIDLAAQAVKEACGGAQIGMILGSGLGEYAGQLSAPKAIAYEKIPGFPVSTVEGHAGQWICGELMGKSMYMMQGRFHAYEGYDLNQVTLPIRVMARLGVQTLIVTNACGGVNTKFNPGDLMLMTDFINMTGLNPLKGPNLDEFGPRFPDMTEVFDKEYIALAKASAKKAGIALQKGVYCWMNGPCYETPAEIRMLRFLGADAVGMSTVPEAIVARHCGMRVLGISCVTNMAAGIIDQPLSHDEVVATGHRAKDQFETLLGKIIHDM